MMTPITMSKTSPRLTPESTSRSSVVLPGISKGMARSKRGTKRSQAKPSGTSLDHRKHTISGNFAPVALSDVFEPPVRSQMNENPDSIAALDEASLRTRLDPVRQRPPSRLPASTWVMLGAAVLFFWSYASLNQRRAVLEQAHAEAVVDERLRATMPLPEPAEGEVASVDGEWAGPEVFSN